MTDQAAPGLLQRFDALSLRERLLLGLTAVVVLVFGWWMLVYESLVPQTHSLEQASQRLESQLQTTRTTLEAIEQRLAQGVHAEQQARIDQMQQRLAQMKQQLNQGTAQLVSPQQMIELMRGMIDSAPRLKLMALRRLEVEPLLPTPDETQADVGSDAGNAASASTADPQALIEEEQAALYRHVMQVRLQGRYVDILKWLEQLEVLPWQLMWNHVELKALEYPVIEIELTLSTISASRAWVEL